MTDNGTRGVRVRRFESGWCEVGNCRLCPHVIRIERTTPKGTPLRRIECTCRCHKEEAK